LLCGKRLLQRINSFLSSRTLHEKEKIGSSTGCACTSAADEFIWCCFRDGTILTFICVDVSCVNIINIPRFPFEAVLILNREPVIFISI